MTDILHETFTITRAYEKSRDLVWSGWSDQAKKTKWMGGGLERMEFAPGGSERHVFNDQMGQHVNDTRYFEIVPGQRIILAYSMALNGRVHSVSLTTVTFADQGGGTLLTYTEQMTVLPPSDGLQGRRHGWTAILDSLDKALADEV